MQLKVTIYLDVISSWCFWAQPAWEELKKRYAGRVDFEWKIALMDASGFPKSVEQAEWFYRRSGMMMRSPFMLKPGWFEPNLEECLAPKLIAEAARDLGVTDDRVRMALANATEREGQRTNDWNLAAEIGATAGWAPGGNTRGGGRCPSRGRRCWGGRVLRRLKSALEPAPPSFMRSRSPSARHSWSTARLAT